MTRKNFHTLSENLHTTLKEVLPSMVNTEVNKIAKITSQVYFAQGLLLDKQKTQVNDAIANHIPSQFDSLLRNYMSNNILRVHPTQTAKATAREQQYQLYMTMKDNNITTATACRPFAIRLRDHDDYQDDDAYPKGENNVKRQKTLECGTYLVGESSSGQAMEQDPNLSGSNDDEVPNDKASQELVEEMSEVINEAKLQKATDEMLRQRSGKKDYLYQIQRKSTSCFELPKRSKSTTIDSDESRPFLSQAWELRTKESMWAMQDHIRRQKKLRDKPHEVFSKSKIVEIIRTTYEVGYEHNFIIEIIARRANGMFVSIIEPDYKYPNMNDIKDMHLLCINDKVKDYRETGILGSLVTFIKATVIWERVHDF
ncbi:hypothetical protein Tco_1056072 [Tanacetum coccineum]|uniref:Uncharacterized protein n=1 Tax=Tanacetum coccineum TaxID=301880 RepID=A0ABQ5H255_9ASTR